MSRRKRQKVQVSVLFLITAGIGAVQLAAVAWWLPMIGLAVGWVLGFGWEMLDEWRDDRVRRQILANQTRLKGERRRAA